jgi:hypothetical protein
MSDLGDDLERLEGLADRRMSLGGYRFTPTQLGMAMAAIGSLLGTLYAGFLMYQKVEALASLDLDAVQGDIQQIQIDLQKNNDYTRDIKNGLRDDILRIEKVADRVEDDVNNLEDKVRQMIDDAEIRFETKREQLRMSQKADLKELEDRLNKKVQLALDNPLAN